MDFQQALDSVYGVQFRAIPEDGKMRKFKIGNSEGFAIRFPGCGAFGCFGRNEIYTFAGGAYKLLAKEQKPVRLSRSVIRAEQMIVNMGNAMSDEGVVMSDADMDRYIQALENVMGAKND